ncbi:hypothetical protein AB1Y20_011472 [Prymnesium parvum]|uniref:Protein xylosyltransferase n=1 Tax=Prymnesium parvum TaxID=97485 RepID=A0AB34IJJ5_PRYPA
MQFRAYYPCYAGTEGSPVRWLPRGAGGTWVVMKSREIGAPAQRLCEAELLTPNRSSEWSDSAQMRSIWSALPGRPRWRRFDALRPDGNASAKRLAAPPSRGARCLGPELARPNGGCRPLLFVAQLADERVRPRGRGAALLERARRDEAQWQLAAPPQHGAVCPLAHVRVATPRIFTARALRAAVRSGLCSRACAAGRMKYRIAAARARPPAAPCLTEEANSHCQVDSSSVVLVVAHWSADLEWLQQQPFCFVVSEKYESGADYIDYAVPNKGNEASSYLNFILTHYDDLPDTMIFLQDEQISKHNQNMVLILRQLRLDAAPYIPLNNVYMPFMDPRDFCSVRKCIAMTGLSRYLNHSVLPLHHLDIAFTCCAQFLVSRRAVLQQPREMYESLYRYTLGATDFGQRSDSFARGECLEVLWHVIFGAPRVERPFHGMHKCGKLSHALCDYSPLHAFVPANDTFWSWAMHTWFGMTMRERAALRRRPEGALFAAAARRGDLCVLPPAPHPAAAARACTRVSDGNLPALLRQARAARATVPSLGHAVAAITTNCSLLGSAPLSRRKLVKTLRLHCTGPQPDNVRTSTLQFRHALCALFESEVEQLRSHRRTALTAGKSTL